MKPIEQLRSAVRELYSAKDPNRADWADWIYENHVLLVADEAVKIAVEFGGNPDLAEAAGLLHDVADAVMKREDSGHEENSLAIARNFMRKAGYALNEIAIVVDDAIVRHGCHGDIRPATLEGKAMASGDAVVHLVSDFYEFAEKEMLVMDSRRDIARWALPKIDRDFINKIAYDDVRKKVEPDYIRLKNHFHELLSV
jgi:HD superfamily phosphodiesterase